MGQGSSSLHGEETKRIHSPGGAPEARRDVPEKRAPPASAGLWPPSNSLPSASSQYPAPSHTTKIPERTEAAAQGDRHGAHSPLEFWELLFVSSKWFCALPSTLRLKALSAGWGEERARKNHGDWSATGPKGGACQRGLGRPGTWEPPRPLGWVSA